MGVEIVKQKMIWLEVIVMSEDKWYLELEFFRYDYRVMFVLFLEE